MWSPTHVQVTVQRAKSLLTKGKHGTNDCFVTIGLGKEKFQTSVKEKAEENVEWHEECDLMIPTQGNTAEVSLTVLHRNFIGDQFLGQVTIPLAGLDVYERPKNRWYKLEGKSGKESTKNRGDIEVKIGFTVKEGSLTDLSKKEKYKSSMGQLSLAAQNMGGSLLSIGSLEKRKGLKKFAKNLGSKMHLNKKEKKSDTSSLGGSALSLQNTGKPVPTSPFHGKSSQAVGQADPGVISEDEDEFAFDDLSHKSSGSSLNVNNNSTLPRVNKFIPSPANASLENLGGGELLRRSTSGGIGAPEKSPPPKPVRLGLEEITHAPKAPEIVRKDEWSQKLLKGKVQSQILIEKEKMSSQNNKSVENLTTVLKEKTDSPKFFKKFTKEKSKKSLGERIIIGEEGIIDEVKLNPAYTKLPKDIVQNFEAKSREDLVVMAWSLQNEVDSQKKKVKDLENYLDELLLRVMETTPRILQNPYSKSNLIKNK